jgi:hypothetical protein
LINLRYAEWRVKRRRVTRSHLNEETPANEEDPGLFRSTSSQGATAKALSKIESVVGRNAEPTSFASFE